MGNGRKKTHGLRIWPASSIWRAGCRRVLDRPFPTIMPVIMWWNSRHRRWPFVPGAVRFRFARCADKSRRCGLYTFIALNGNAVAGAVSADHGVVSPVSWRGGKLSSATLDLAAWLRSGEAQSALAGFRPSARRLYLGTDRQLVRKYRQASYIHVRWTWLWSPSCRRV